MLCDNLEKWDEGGGSGFKKEGIYIYLWPIQLMSGKNHNIVKQLSSKLIF